MPVHQSHTVQRGTESHLVFVFAADPTTGGPATRLELDAARAGYVASGGAATTIPIGEGDVGRWAPGSLVEVDPDLLPGVYQFGVPDAVLQGDGPEAVLVIQIPDAVVDPVKFNLVAYDPQDAWSLGMTQLQDYKRHQVLRQALPRFTEMELALGRENEQVLADQLGEVPPDWVGEG